MTVIIRGIQILIVINGKNISTKNIEHFKLWLNACTIKLRDKIESEYGFHYLVLLELP